MQSRTFAVVQLLLLTSCCSAYRRVQVDASLGSNESALDQDVEERSSSVGKCTNKEIQSMSAMGRGSYEGSFPYRVGKCSIESWHLNIFMTKLGKGKYAKALSDYVECIKNDLGVTDKCASCFKGEQVYAWDKCRRGCLRGKNAWCETKCLRCIGAYELDLRRCVGRMPPRAVACDDGIPENPNPTTTTTTEANSADAGGTDESPATDVTFNGDCTADDKKAMEAAGGGNADSSFAGICSTCGKASVDWKLSWKGDKYVKCVADKTKISKKCASCFSVSGAYGLKNCKMPCMSSWCGKACLQCVSGQATARNKCVGFSPPGTWACDGSGYMKPAPTTTGAPTPAVATTTTTTFVQTGDCTPDDQKAMQKAGGGNGDSSFAGKCSSCGKKSVDWKLSWKGDKYVNCVNSEVGISKKCAQCFSVSGAYGLSNCKMPCMSSWCSKGCLSCVAGQAAERNKCVGFSPPGTWACDGSGYGKPADAR